MTEIMKRVLIVVVALVIGFSCGWLCGRIWRPDYPEGWNQIKVGMSAQEISKIEPRLSADMREAKGFDQMAIDFGDRYWQLLVTYDASLHAQRVDKHYIFKSCGLLNRTISETKQE